MLSSCQVALHSVRGASSFGWHKEPSGGHLTLEVAGRAGLVRGGLFLVRAAVLEGDVEGEEESACACKQHPTVRGGTKAVGMQQNGSTRKGTGEEPHKKTNTLVKRLMQSTCGS